MPLVVLCREQDFKHFIQEAVLSWLIWDLKELKHSAMVLYSILGGGLSSRDHSGSRNIDGFEENFSTYKTK